MSGFATRAEDDAAESLRDDVLSRYGGRPEDVSVVRSPLRVSPLGAHVDHQLGRVCGMAIDRSVLLAFRPSASSRTRLRSRNYPGDVSFDLGSMPPPDRGSWGEYARGAARALLERYPLDRGIEGVVQGFLPAGGASSSAAVGVAYLLALEAANGLRIPPEENVDLDRHVENVTIGLENGILDPSVILLSCKDELLHLDTRTRAWESVPFGGDPDTFRILIVHSGVGRTLISTDYNKHVAECREAAARLLAAGAAAGVEGASVTEPETDLRIEPGTPLLGLVPREVYEAHAGDLPEHLARRARHFYDETARVLEGVDAWRRGDLGRFGDLMDRSCESSIGNYRCGSAELIRLYEILRRLEGVFGCRFSGAGYGGCAIALVDPLEEERIAGRVRAEYLDSFPERRDGFEVFSCRPADGACIP